MQTSEWKWKSRDGLEMYSTLWAPDVAPRALVILIHGHGEHIHRYDHVGQAFSNAGYALAGFDVRGHGRSGGQRGHSPSYENLLDDIRDFMADMQKRYSQSPVFLYGHSMGGNQVINFALRYPQGLRGVIVTGPWLRLAFEPSAFQLTLAKVMKRIAPAFSQASGLEQAAISSDPEVVHAYATDPLVHEKITAGLFSMIHANGEWALAHAADLKIPMLLMHGSADRLTSADASKEFAGAAGDLVTLRIWDGLFHEIHNEPVKTDVLKIMTDWIDRHLQTAPASAQ